MPGLNIREIAAKAGFTGRALDTIVAIVMAESGGNPQAYNGNRKTGDSSYGLAQINMLGAMGPERRKAYGLSSNDDLFDPVTNLKVAYALSNGGKNFTPWSTYKSGAYEKYLGSHGPVQSQSSPSVSPGNLGLDMPAPGLPSPTAAPQPSNSASGTKANLGIYDKVMGPDAPGSDGFVDPFDAPDTLPVMSEQDYNSLYTPNLTANAQVYDKVQSAPVQVNNPRQADRATSEVSGKAQRIVQAAQQMVGLPYVWGGTNARSGVDCSGLVKLAYQAAGIDLPRVSFAQADAGQRIGLGALRPGDLVAWDNSTRNNGADHIAVYIGGGQIIEAPRPGTNVRVRKLGENENAWGVRILGQ